jgi:hypothetical protein
MGKHADQSLDRLPTPKKEDEVAILVASADCKGIPVVKKDTEKVDALKKSEKNPGNRRMATVTTVYSVDPIESSPEDIVAALFRDDREEATIGWKRITNLNDPNQNSKTHRLIFRPSALIKTKRFRSVVSTKESLGSQSTSYCDDKSTSHWYC